MILLSIFLTPNTKEELLAVIDSVRSDLISIGMKEGLNSSKTIEISQKLDVLITKYQKITRNNSVR